MPSWQAPLGNPKKHARAFSAGGTGKSGAFRQVKSAGFDMGVEMVAMVAMVAASFPQTTLVGMLGLGSQGT